MRQRLFFIVTVLVLIAGAISMKYIYSRSEIDLELKMSQIFEQAVRLDKDTRMKEHPFFVICVPSFKDSSVIVMRTADTVVYIDKSKVQGKTSDEKSYMMDQMDLLMENPIRISRLDSLFAQGLHEKQIPAETAVVYEMDGVKQVSRADSSFYTSSRKLEEVVIELEHKIVLQGFVKVPVTFILSQALWLYILVGISWLLIGCVFVWLAIRKNVITKQDELAANQPLIPEGFTLIAENLLFNRERGVLKYNNEEEIILANYKQKLFVLLLDHKGEYVLPDTIMLELWPDGMSSRDALLQTVKRLRKDLEPIPFLRVENLRAGGYRLFIDEESEPSPLPANLSPESPLPTA